MLCLSRVLCGRGFPHTVAVLVGRVAAAQTVDRSLSAGGARGLWVPALIWLRAFVLGALQPVPWSHEALLCPFLTHDPPAARAARWFPPLPPCLREPRTFLTPSRGSLSRREWPGRLLLVLAASALPGALGFSELWGDRDTPSAESHGFTGRSSLQPHPQGTPMSPVHFPSMLRASLKSRSGCCGLPVTHQPFGERAASYSSDKPQNGVQPCLEDN